MSTTGGPGTGGSTSGTGGATVSASGGATGATGGGSGSGGRIGTGGATGSGGASSTGGAAGTAGRAGTGGAAGATVGGTGGATGTGGRTGTGGAAGSPVSGSGGVAGTGGRTGTGGATQTGLPAGVTHLFPAPNGTALCPDPPLHITFSGPPTLGSSGRIQVFTSSGTAVATVDMAAATVTDVIGGVTFVLVRPVFVDGNDAVIQLKTHATGYGQTYYVNVDPGAIVPPGGGTFSITGTTAWRFATTTAAPSSLSALSVALDGTGQFCTVQGATDALPAGNTAASTITIHPGMYHEIMHVQSKSNITLRGQNRQQTIILGTNNNTQQGATTASTTNRSLLGFDSTNGLTIDSLTIHNLTPQGGSQAEALRLQNCDKCVVRNSDILSLQDTLLWSGRIYATNCTITGNVDYVWGTGVAYFNACEIHTVGRPGVMVQARNAVGAFGYVFVDSKLTADALATSNNLARIDATVYPGSHVAFINCQMTNVSATGWMLTAGTATSSLRFWEYQSTDANGAPINTALRLVGSTQILASEAAMMRDPTVVLAGWQPPP